MAKRLAPVRQVRRPYQRRVRKARFLICVEGEETETSYLDGLMQALRTSLVEIQIGEEAGVDPKRLVELAKRTRNDAKRQARREKDDNLLFNQVWCVFDVDQHTRLPDALQQAADNGINVALSNPCFEIWLLIHFRDQWAYISGRGAKSAVRGYMQNYEKHVEYSALDGKCHDAVNRAKRMEKTAAENGDRFNNPTTGMWRLASELAQSSNTSLEEL